MTDQPPENSTKSKESQEDLEHTVGQEKNFESEGILSQKISPSLEDRFPPSLLFIPQSFWINDSIHCSFSKYHNPLLENIRSINQYFPEYQPIFTYLSFYLSQSSIVSKEFHNQVQNSDIELKKENEPEKIPKNLEKGAMDLPFPYYQRVLIFTPSGHGFANFYYLIEKLYDIHHINLDIHISKPLTELELKRISFENYFASILSENKNQKLFMSVNFTFSNQIKPKLVPNPISLQIKAIIQKIAETFSTRNDILNFPMLLVFDNSLYEAFEGNWGDFGVDFIFNVKLPTYETRLNFLRAIPSLIPKNSIDLEHLARQMENWSFDQIENFYLFSQKYFIMENWNKKWINKEIDTDYVLNLIQNGIFLPHHTQSMKNTHYISQSEPQSASFLKSDSLKMMKNEGKGIFNQDLAEQLFQEISSCCYNEMTLILDKLQKGIVLNKEELSLLGDYPFILKYQPKEALNKMQKAKQRLSQIEKIYNQP